MGGVTTSSPSFPRRVARRGRAGRRRRKPASHPGPPLEGPDLGYERSPSPGSRPSMPTFPGRRSRRPSGPSRIDAGGSGPPVSPLTVAGPRRTLTGFRKPRSLWTEGRRLRGRTARRRPGSPPASASRAGPRPGGGRPGMIAAGGRGYVGGATPRKTPAGAWRAGTAPVLEPGGGGVTRTTPASGLVRVSDIVLLLRRWSWVPSTVLATEGAGPGSRRCAGPVTPV